MCPVDLFFFFISRNLHIWTVKLQGKRPRGTPKCVEGRGGRIILNGY
jgi:hypothetical protein